MAEHQSIIFHYIAEYNNALEDML